MTDRQKEYLVLIVEKYIEDGVPVASSNFISSYKLDVSSATVRNEMNILEKEGFLEKAHVSSGRIPSTKGFDYYAKHISDKDDHAMIDKVEDIFARRRISIDSTLDEAAKAISEMAGLTLVTSTSEVDELLKSIQMTPLSLDAATVVLVTSTGRVESKLIEIKNNVLIEDVRIAIRLFKERLIDSPLRDLSSKVEALAPILSKSVKNYEAILQAFVGKIFDFHNKITNKIYGNSELIKSEGIQRKDLAQLVELMESNSIWSSIEGKLDEDETMKIDVRSNNTSIISKRISIPMKPSKEVSIVGSNRLDYAEAKQVINLIERLLKGEK